MMIERSKQRLMLCGQQYNAADIGGIVGGSNSNYAKALCDVFLFCNEWFKPSADITLHTSGSTGEAKAIQVSKAAMTQGALMTAKFFGLERGDKALLCMDMAHVGAVMMVVRSLVCELDLVVVSASAHPLKDVRDNINFAAMVPYQVYNTMLNEEERSVFKKIDHVIIGGAAIDSKLGKELQSFDNNIYSTYGMTETLSHVALRRINGENASEAYTPLSGVSLSLSNEEVLMIDAPHLNDEPIYTNDIAEMLPNGDFYILGRRDNVVISGGLKLQVEGIEEALGHRMLARYAVSSVEDGALGERLVILVEECDGQSEEDIEVIINDTLDKYSRPKQVITVKRIPLTVNGKINRAECRKLAKQE